MRVLADNNCSAGPCPKLYEDENGELFIQGYLVSDENRSKVDLPKGEGLVKIDRALLDNIRKL